jgi:ATP-dependent DNA helicase RecG
MEEYSAQELFELLNQQDECEWIEAKGGHESSHSVMETVCAFCNEPGMGGGYILLGIAEDKTTLFPQYKTVNIADPDKFQRDFVSQCSSMFNVPVRPKVMVEKVNRDTVIKIQVDELDAMQKPLYFAADGLPGGAYRRVGPTDQRCTEDDMRIFYSNYKSYDQTAIKGTSLNDVDEAALKRYRVLREKVNPVAEELSYSDSELLESLGCLNKENKSELNLAGLVLFATSKTHRMHFPMLRVDYIRVPGNTWVENPDNRFTTIDMRGPLLHLVYRVMDAINSDLPKGFLLPEESMQASSIGLPTKALREAIVNAVMHRSYREHRPIQVIRYNNRIEIINPGYSLKPDDHLGEPGSETRNPYIAAVFHETNLAETKGSGIRAMRKLMAQAHLAPPTFESNRSSNQFTSRLLLHHFLDERDLNWLSHFKIFNLTDGQKQALIFVREVGAIDNQTYRQMTDCDTLKASVELRALKACNLLETKGKGKGTYYVSGLKLSESASEISAPASELSAPVPELSAPVPKLSAPGPALSAPVSEILTRIEQLNKREHDAEKVKNIILDLCSVRSMRAVEIANYLKKGEGYVTRKYLSGMIAEKKLIYLHPEMVNHPEQAYLAAN